VQASPPPIRGSQLVLATFLLGLANFMVVLDAAITNVSIPHIAGALAVSPTQGAWATTSYAAAEAVTVPLSGWLARRFGPVRVFLAALAGFGAFSLLCGLAPTLALLVAFRVAQGLCGGPIMPMSQTLLLQLFPPERSGQALTFWGVTTIIGPILGPMVGGSIVDNAAWGWIFLINVPVAVFTLVGAARLLRGRDPAPERPPMDWAGLALLAAWVAPMEVMLDKGRDLDWFASPAICALAAVTVAALGGFIVRELRTQDPIVNLRVFRHRGFAAGAATIGLTFCGIYGSGIILPLWLQTGMGYTATSSGLATCGMGLLSICSAPLVGRLVNRVDARILGSMGVGWMALIAIWRSGMSTEADFMAVLLPSVMTGLGMGFFYVPVTDLALQAVDPSETAAATGITNFLRTTAAAFGVSISTTAWENFAASDHEQLAAALPHAQLSLGALMDRGAGEIQARAAIDALVSGQSLVLAANQVFLAAAGVFVVAGLFLWLAPRSGVTSFP